jgi:regulator of cell morphogenesis and NO signaling
MNPFTQTDRLGDIVVAFPKSAELFQRYRIDYCCGGDRSLQVALDEQHVPVDAVLNELNALARTIRERGNDWQNLTSPQLVDHIVMTHHAFLWENLPKLSELTTTLLRVHGVNHPELKTLHALVGALKTELEGHLLKEETVQYPAIAAYFNDPSPQTLKPALSVIRELEHEHLAAGNLLKQIREVTQDFTVPEDGCATFRKTYALLEATEKDIFQHIHLENNLLFPQLANLHSAL